MNTKMLLLIALVISANNAMSMEEDGKQDIQEIEINQEIEVNHAQPTQFSIKKIFVNVVNNGVKKTSKKFGIIDITAESTKDFNNNLKCLSDVQSKQQFISDLNNNSAFSSNTSFVKRSMDKNHAYQAKGVDILYEMQKNNSTDVNMLNNAQESFARADAYHAAISKVCKIQLELIRNRINNALENNNENNNK